MTFDLRSIARALGGELSGRQVLAPGPGHSRGDRSLAVCLSKNSPDGFLVHSHAGDPWKECRDYVKEKLGRPVASSTDKTTRAIAIWNEGIDPRGTLVERYLRGRRLELPADIAMRVVRFHPSCPWERYRGPCMLTAYRLIKGDRVVAVQRTLLSDDGKKIDRKMLGAVAGAAIKIDARENVEYGLTVGEGFETCLAARQLGFRPVWALGSATAIGTFPVLSGIDALTILAETDDKGANAGAIKACGSRWAAADREVIVARPRVVGDMNDALQA